MPFITFKPSGKKIKAGNGDDLFNIIKEAGVDIDFPCGAKGTCGRCIVKIESGKVDSDSTGKLSISEISDGYVCACRTKLMDTDITVLVPDHIKQTGENCQIFLRTPNWYRRICSQLILIVIR